MSEVHVEVSLSVLRKIEASLRECGEDLRAEVENRYQKSARQQYPTMQRRYERDLEPAVRAIARADVLRDLLPPKQSEDPD